MKTFLIATAALSIMGGAAFAQTTAATPGAMASPGSTQGAMAGTDPSTGSTDAAPAAGSSTATPAPSAGASMPDSSTSAPMVSGSTMAANTPSGSPPAAYPVCTSKKEDRCVNRYQATRTASTMHMKKMKHAATMAPDAAATGDQAPAATPST